jgi:hypothetical protein
VNRQPLCPISEINGTYGITGQNMQNDHSKAICK